MSYGSKPAPPQPPEAALLVRKRWGLDRDKQFGSEHYRMQLVFKARLHRRERETAAPSTTCDPPRSLRRQNRARISLTGWKFEARKLLSIRGGNFIALTRSRLLAFNLPRDGCRLNNITNRFARPALLMSDRRGSWLSSWLAQRLRLLSYGISIRGRARRVIHRLRRPARPVNRPVHAWIGMASHGNAPFRSGPPWIAIGHEQFCKPAFFLY